MKNILTFLSFISVLAIFTCISSCKTGEGCGLEEKYSAKIDGDGNMSTKRGKSNLFSKKQQKKMKK
jgi:hypothetical protein